MEWEDYKDRIFYVGNIRRWIYETIKRTLPNIVDEPLWSYERDTSLAKDLNKLYHIVCNSLYNDKKYWNGEFKREKDPEADWHLQPETHLWAKPGIIQMFKEPSYEWLRDKVNSLNNQELHFPIQVSSFKKSAEPVEEVAVDNNKLDKQNYCIDIETEPFTDSPLKELMLKSIQLDNNFIPVTSNNLPTLKKQLQNKELIVFNAPFEQTQLSRAGFDVLSNRWLDVSLLTKLYDNRLAEERIASLGDLEKRLLGESTRNNLVTKLEEKYGKVT